MYEFCLELIKKHALVPEFFRCNDKYNIRWIPPYNNNIIQDIIHYLSYECPENLITFNKKKLSKKTQVITITSIIIKGFIDNYLENIPETKKSKYEKSNIINLFLGNAQRFDKNKSEELENSINNWIKAFSKQASNYIIYLEIIELDKDFKIEVKVSVDNKETEEITQVIEKTDDETLKSQLLNDCQIIDNVLPKMNTSIENNENIIFTANEFAKFFNEVIPILETIGVKIIMPKELKNKFHPKLLLEIHHDNKNSYLSLENLLKYDWKIAIGDTR